MSHSARWEHCDRWNTNLWEALVRVGGMGFSRIDWEHGPTTETGVWTHDGNGIGTSGTDYIMTKNAEIFPRLSNF